MSSRSLVILCALAGSAAADDDEDGPELPPVPDRGIGFGVIAHSGMLGGIEESDVGPTIELALGKSRTQYYVDTSVTAAKLGRGDAAIDGSTMRGGAGLRWLARSFELGSNGAIDLHLEGFAGAARVKFEGMKRIWRPELGVGIGYQLRGYWKQNKRHVAFRVSARLYFAPVERDVAMEACRGCETRGGTNNSGMAVFLGGEL